MPSRPSTYSYYSCIQIPSLLLQFHELLLRPMRKPDIPSTIMSLNLGPSGLTKKNTIPWIWIRTCTSHPPAVCLLMFTIKKNTSSTTLQMFHRCFLVGLNMFLWYWPVNHVEIQILATQVLALRGLDAVKFGDKTSPDADRNYMKLPYVGGQNMTRSCTHWYQV